MVECRFDALPERGAILGTPAKSVYFKLVTVMCFIQFYGQKRHRMHAEIGGEIADPQLFMPVIMPERHHPRMVFDLGFDKMPACRQLCGGVIAQSQHGNRRGFGQNIGIGPV